MKTPMKHTIVFAACMVAFSAHASCGERGIPNEVCVPETTPVTGQQGQAQGQLQGQAQQARSRSTSGAAATGTLTSNGNGASAGAGAGAGAGSGSGVVTIHGDAAGSGDTYKSLALALPSVPMTPPSFVAGAVVTTTVSACGPLQRAVAEPVYGEHNGLFSNSKVWLGNTEKTELYLNERGDVQPYTAIGGRWFGHQVIYSTAALGVSSASNLAIGGGASGGGWGQGGGGSSGAMQRLVTTVQLRFCDVGAVPAPVAAVVVPTPVALVTVRKPAPRRAPIRKVVAVRPDPTCLASAAASCQVKPASTLQIGKKS